MNKVKKIIVRKIALYEADIRFKLREMDSIESITSKNEFIQRHGFKKILKIVFREDVEEERLEDTELYEAYEKILNTHEENEYFKEIYQINDRYGVQLDANIYFYPIINVPNIAGEILLPWIYVGNKVYGGDTWWNTDEEILADIMKLPYMEFVSKYRTY